MGARGRKTQADLAVKKSELEQQGLPTAPEHLPLEAQAEWNDIVSSYPVDRFPRATWPMLEAYCRHTVNARRIGKMMDGAENPTVSEYNSLLIMLNRETKTLASFGVRLGIARTSMAGRHNDDPDDIVTDHGTPWANGSSRTGH